MSIKRIDRASELDPDSISFSTLKWGVGTGIDTSTGKGAYKKASYRLGVMTELGDIEETLWYQLMEQLIERQGEQCLLDFLIQWEREHNYRKQSAADIRKEALQSHSHRIFDNPRWVCFIPFNRQFRPSVLEQARIVTVINECCGLPGEVTREQIDGAHSGTVCCPHCGRWSPFEIVRKDSG